MMKVERTEQRGGLDSDGDRWFVPIMVVLPPTKNLNYARAAAAVAEWAESAAAEIELPPWVEEGEEP